MKVFGIVLVGCIMLIAACANEGKITQGSPAYELGKQLATNLPFMDPDSNKVLVSSKYYNISAGDMLTFLKNQFGHRTGEILKMDKRQMTNFIVSSIHGLSDKKLLLHAAEQAGVRATAEQVMAVLEPQYKQAGSEAAYVLGQEQQGLDINYIKEDVKKRMIIDNYLDRIVDEQSKVSDADIQNAYEAYQKEELASVRHILLLTQDKSEEEKTQIHLRMKEILKRARAGEDFGELAKQYTEDPGSKETGGLYENFGRGTMVPPFEEAAFNVPVGEISDIVETRYGYHILKVVARSTGTKTLDEMKEELKDKLQKGEWNSIVPAHIQTLKTEAEVTLASFLQ